MESQIRYMSNWRSLDNMKIIKPIEFDWKYGPFINEYWLKKEQLDNNYKTLEKWSLKIEKWLIFNSCLSAILLLSIIVIIIS